MIVFDSIKSIEFILFPFLHGKKKEQILDFFQEQVTAGRNEIH